MAPLAPAAPPAPAAQARLQVLEQRTRALLEAGQYEEAIGPLLEAAELAPNNASVFSDLGLACLRSQRLTEAIDWLRRSLQLRPNFARTHYNLATALQAAGDDDGAFRHYQWAATLDPKLVDAHNRLGDMLVAIGREPEAAASFERAAKVAGGTTSAGRLCRAKALVARHRLEEAEVELRRLVADDPGDSEAHRRLGHVLSDTGRFAEAEPEFAQSIGLAPWHVTGYYPLVQSRRQTGADRPVIARMIERLADDRIADPNRMVLHFAIAKALDDIADYEGAIVHFDAANAIRRRFSFLDHDELAARVSRVMARYTREFFAANPSLGCVDATPLFVLGMPRSGTTLTERILSSHRDVVGGGELVFWNHRGPDAVFREGAGLRAAVPRLQQDYLRVLCDIGPDARHVTDKMPFNFLWLGLIHLCFPSARIIHCRRNPIDTCLSIYTTYFSSKWNFASDRGDLVFYYRQYERLMDHWRAVLPPNRFFEVDYEAMTADGESHVRRLVAFCGLDWDSACLAPERNRDVVKTASVWQARQPIYRSSVERWRRYEPWLGELRTLLPAEA